MVRSATGVIRRASLSQVTVQNTETSHFVNLTEYLSLCGLVTHTDHMTPGAAPLLRDVDRHTPFMLDIDAPPFSYAQ